MGGKGPKIATGHVEIIPDMAKFRAQVERSFARANVRKSIQNELRAAEQTITDRLVAMGPRLQDVGRSLTRAVTLPLVGVGALSVKSAIDFETAFAGVRKTVDGTEEQFASLERGIRDMAVATGTSATDLTAIAEAAGALGIPTQDILKFVDVVNKLDVATDLTADSAATSLGKLRNVLNLSVDDLDNLSAAVVDLGNTGSSTEPEIIALALRLAAAGRIAGFSTSDILAFAAAAADAGVEAEAGGTALSKTFREIGSAISEGGADLEGFAKVAGVTAEEFSEQWEKDPARATAAFIRGLQRIRKEAGSGGVTKALKDLGITESRQIDTLQRLAIAQTDLNVKLDQSGKAYKDATAAQSEFDKLMATSGKKIDVLKTTFAELGIQLGERLLPILTKPETIAAIQNIADSLGDVIEWFGDLDPAWQERIVKLFAFAVVGGPVLSGLGSVVGLLRNMRDILNVTRGAKYATDLAKIGTNAGTASGQVGGLVRSLEPLAAMAATGLAIKITVDVVNKAKEFIDDPAEFIGNDPERVAQVNSLTDALIGHGADAAHLGKDKFFEFLEAMGKLERNPRLFAEFADDFYRLLRVAQKGGDVLAELNKILDEMNGKKVEVALTLPVDFAPTAPGGAADLILAGVEKRHSGGPISAGKPYIIRNDESMIFPGSDGWVLPPVAPHALPGSKRPVVVQVALDRRVIAEAIMNDLDEVLDRHARTVD